MISFDPSTLNGFSKKSNIKIICQEGLDIGRISISNTPSQLHTKSQRQDDPFKSQLNRADSSLGNLRNTDGRSNFSRKSSKRSEKMDVSAKGVVFDKHNVVSPYVDKEKQSAITEKMQHTLSRVDSNTRFSSSKSSLYSKILT